MRLDDPFGVRSLVARWVIRATVSLESAAHFGGAHDDDDADMMLLRDRVSGRPLLPGTSLAGALRSHLADRLGGYASNEPELIELLFGGRGDDPGHAGPQSNLIVFDALGVLPAGLPTEIRDGVAIEAATGVAEEHFKYDLEVLPAGTTFEIRIDLLVPSGGTVEALAPAFDEKPTSVEDALVALAIACVDGLDGEISLGAKRSRGFGRLSVSNWQVERYDLSNRAGWLEWLASDHDHPSASQHYRERLGRKPAVIDARERTVVTARLEIDGALQIASPSPDPDGADLSHLRSAGRPVLSGTSLAGALRNRAVRIAHLVRPNDAQVWVDGLFGPRNESNLKASRLRVSESYIRGERRLRSTRIRIDRFTHGVVDGALFDEEPQIGGSVEVRLELRRPTPGETGFLLLLLKDLLTGDLPVGGTTSIGRGVLKGTAAVEIADGGHPISIGFSPDDDEAERLNRAVFEFHSVPETKGALI